MTEEFCKYSKAIGVSLKEKDLILENLAYRGFNEKLPKNFIYEIIENKIHYKNCTTGSIYEIHPNYQKYREMVQEHKNKIDSINSDLIKLENLTNKSECIDNLKEIRYHNKTQIEDIQKSLKSLDIEYNTEMDLLRNHVKNATKGQSNNLLVAELTQKYEEFDKCKIQAKTLYRICKSELEKICIEIENLQVGSDLDTDSDEDYYINSSDKQDPKKRSNLACSYINGRKINYADSSSNDDIFDDNLLRDKHFRPEDYDDDELDALSKCIHEFSFLPKTSNKDN